MNKINLLKDILQIMIFLKFFVACEKPLNLNSLELSGFSINVKILR